MGVQFLSLAQSEYVQKTLFNIPRWGNIHHKKRFQGKRGGVGRDRRKLAKKRGKRLADQSIAFRSTFLRREAATFYAVNKGEETSSEGKGRKNTL